MVIQVHGVVSPDEALWYEARGATVIGVILGEAPTGRSIDLHVARAIGAVLTRARLCVEPAGNATLAPSEAHGVGAGWVQVRWGPEVSRPWRESLAALGVGWALARVPAAEDDDPSWVRSRLVEAGPPSPAWAHLELCPFLEDGWPVIRELNPDELDVADLDALARDLPVLVSMPFSAAEVPAVRAALPHVRGFVFALGDELGSAPGAHTCSPNAIAEVLAALARR